MRRIERKIRNGTKVILHSLFVTGQKFGLDILPRHFYSNIPNIRELRNTSAWRAARSMVGIAGSDLDGQLAFARDCCSPDLRERLRCSSVYDPACKENGEGYGPVESDFLFCFISTKRPKRIIQIGAGLSTALILQALEEANCEAEIVCIDPYPTE